MTDPAPHVVVADNACTGACTTRDADTRPAETVANWRGSEW